MTKLLASFLFILLTANNYAEETSRIQTEISAKTTYIGSPVHLVYKIFRPENSKIKTPDALHMFKGMEIKNFTINEEKTEENYIQSTLDYTLVSFEPGTHSLEAVPFEIETGPGDKITLQSESVSLSVESLVKDPSKENDIRGPKNQMPLNESPLIPILIVIFLLLLIALAAFIARKTLIKKEILVKDEIRLSADEEAIRQLEQLLQSEDLKQRNMKAVYTKLTDILRNYLGLRYIFDAREMTSFECLKEIKTRKLSSELFEKIKSSLEKSDLVKFARFLPEAVEIPQDIETAKNIVLETREAIHAP